MNYIFFEGGVVAIEATLAAFTAIQNTARQIGDDVANFWSNADDASALPVL